MHIQLHKNERIRWRLSSPLMFLGHLKNTLPRLLSVHARSSITCVNPHSVHLIRGKPVSSVSKENERELRLRVRGGVRWRGRRGTTVFSPAPSTVDRWVGMPRGQKWQKYRIWNCSDGKHFSSILKLANEEVVRLVLSCLGLSRLVSTYFLS